jgi:valyl-tRNA synthetase
MVLPPPNVTGELHMGSALMLALEDIMVRHARMSGKKTLWIPGTDSAAIATQARVEKDIQKAEKKTRHDLGREELLKRIDTFVEEKKGTILSQMRSIGASLSTGVATPTPWMNNATKRLWRPLYACITLA